MNKIALSAAFLLTSAILTSQARAQCTDSALNGPYAYHLIGASATQAFAAEGLLVADGSGNLTVNDTITVVGVPSQGSNNTGQYSVNPDCTGSITLRSSVLGQIYLDFVLVSGNSELLFVGSNQGERIYGTAKQAGTAACSLATLSGSYGFHLGGLATTSGVITEAGRFVSDGNGNLTLITDTISVNGAITRGEQNTGTYTVNSNCTGTLLLRSSTNSTRDYNFVFANGNQELFLVGADNVADFYGEAIAAVNPFPPGVGTISSISFNPNPVAGGSTSTATVTLSSPAGPGGVTVTISSNTGSATVPTTIVVPPGQTSATFPVTTSPVTSTTTATVTATSGNSISGTLTINPSSGTGGQGTITGISVVPNPVTGGNSAIGTVTISSPAGPNGVLVNLSSNNANATLPASVTIPSGQSSTTFPVNTNVVSSQVMAQLTATSANTATTTLTINPSGNGGQGTISGVSFNPNPVTGGSPSTGTVTLTAPAGPNGVQVTLMSNTGTATVPPTITIPAGQSSGTFPVNTSPVTSPTPATITATSANSAAGMLTINPSGPGLGTISGISFNPNPVTGGSPSTGTVTLTAPAGPNGVQVTLGSNTGSATVPTTITIPAGQSSGTFPVSTSTVPSQTTAMITATSANSVAGTLTINPSGAGQGTITGISVVPNPVTGGNQATGTVSISTPAGASGVLVSLSSNNSNATVPASVTIPSGQSSATFPVNTSAVTSQMMAQLTATSANTASTTLTVNPSGPGQGTIASLTLNPNPVTGGNPSTGTVTLTAPAPANGALVTLSSDTSNATVPTSITIPAGQSSGTFGVSTAQVNTQTLAHITATSANSASTTLIINPTPCVQNLTLNVNAVTGGNPVTATVTLTSPAPSGGQTVQLLYTGAGVSGPPSILVNPGQTMANFQVSTNTVAAIVMGAIQALTGPCPGVTANLQVNPVPVLTSVTVNPMGISLGGQALGTVTLSAPSTTATTVMLATTIPGTQISIPATVTIPAGAQSATFPVFSLAPGLAGLLSPVTGAITATLGGVNVNSGVTLLLM